MIMMMIMMIIINMTITSREHHQPDSASNTSCHQRSSSLPLQRGAESVSLYLYPFIKGICCQNYQPSFLPPPPPQLKIAKMTCSLHVKVLPQHQQETQAQAMANLIIRSNKMTHSFTMTKHDFGFTLTLARDPILLPTRNSTFSSWIWKRQNILY